MTGINPNEAIKAATLNLLETQFAEPWGALQASAIAHATAMRESRKQQAESQALLEQIQAEMQEAERLFHAPDTPMLAAKSGFAERINGMIPRAKHYSALQERIEKSFQVSYGLQNRFMIENHAFIAQLGSDPQFERFLSAQERLYPDKNPQDIYRAVDWAIGQLVLEIMGAIEPSLNTIPYAGPEWTSRTSALQPQGPRQLQ